MRNVSQLQLRSLFSCSSRSDDGRTLHDAHIPHVSCLQLSLVANDNEESEKLVRQPLRSRFYCCYQIYDVNRNHLPMPFTILWALRIAITLVPHLSIFRCFFMKFDTKVKHSRSASSRKWIRMCCLLFAIRFSSFLIIARQRSHCCCLLCRSLIILNFHAQTILVLSPSVDYNLHPRIVNKKRKP